PVRTFTCLPGDVSTLYSSPSTFSNLPLISSASFLANTSSPVWGGPLGIFCSAAYSDAELINPRNIESMIQLTCFLMVSSFYLNLQSWAHKTMARAAQAARDQLV